MKNLIVIISILLTLFSCKKEVEKVEFNAEVKEIEVLKDSTLIEFSDLPFRIDSTNFLIHAKGYFIENSRVKYGSKSFSRNDNYHNNYMSIVKKGNNRIVGNMTNIKFQNFNSDSLKPLTTKKLLINSIEYLKDYYKSSKNQILIYKIRDIDTNTDKILNYEDVQTLYISNIDGFNFKKLTNKYFELIDFNYFKENHTLYFRSYEDINKDGKFEKEDKIHYQYIKLNDKDWEVKAYNPL